MKVAVIGAGPGGYTAAFESAARGWETWLVENGRLGGTCLNHGCIPTKSLRASADAMNMAKRLAEFGVAISGEPRIQMPAVQERKAKIVDTLVDSLEKTCDRLKINTLRGIGRVTGPGLVEIKTDATSRMLECDAIIIAAGSSIMELPGLPFDHRHILDSNDALELDYVPKSVLIVGGGVIGCELAFIYRSFGSEVTVVEAADRLLPLPSVDADISAFMAREARKRKIRLVTGSTVKKAAIIDDAICRAEIAPFGDSASGASVTTVEAEKIFVTVGRKPAIPAIALEEAGIEVDSKCWIVVDENMQTSRQGIYAVGDILGPARMMLAHVAAMEGMRAVDAIGGTGRKMNYEAVPSAIFTEPEVASVGMTEARARDTFGHVACGTAQMRSLGKAHAMGELPGFCKLVANAENGKILGAHIAGARASDLVGEATLAISENISIFELAEVIHAHPTMAEALFEAAHATAAAIKKIRSEME